MLRIEWSIMSIAACMLGVLPAFAAAPESPASAIGSLEPQDEIVKVVLLKKQVQSKRSQAFVTLDLESKSVRLEKTSRAIDGFVIFPPASGEEKMALSYRVRTVFLSDGTYRTYAE